MLWQTTTVMAICQHQYYSWQRYLPWKGRLWNEQRIVMLWWINLNLMNHLEKRNIKHSILELDLRFNLFLNKWVVFNAFLIYFSIMQIYQKNHSLQTLYRLLNLQNSVIHSKNKSISLKHVYNLIIYLSFQFNFHL